MANQKYNVAFVEVSPNWHRPEFFKRLSEHEQIDLTVYYCSDESLNGKVLSSAFGAGKTNWGIDFFDGYKYRLLKNYGTRHAPFMKTSVFSHMNLAIWREIARGQHDAVVIKMWNDISYWLAALCCAFKGIPFFWAGDATILNEERKSTLKRSFRKLLLGQFLFRLASGCMHIGRLGKEFYQAYGMDESRLFFYPHTVDVDYYESQYILLNERRPKLRQEAGLDDDTLLVIYAGRLSEEKRPLDVVEAFTRLKKTKASLFVLGDGKLRSELELFIKKRKLQNVHLLGFQPKNRLMQYYAMADALVLPSSEETHGAVVNEAMCFALPIIASNRVGASHEIVEHGQNGYVYDCGDFEQLAKCIDSLADSQKRVRFGRRSLDIIKNWDHQVAIDGLVRALDHACKR